ncbi:Similar to aspartate aminotransferase [Candidatus Methanoperedens nitroreducens]|uniref:Similar to aspartate aminotransferase n=2 Tax=Candidatus Methanoperedens nitratireducens TaxID=1392998 RepID=A0A284VKJ3_9EURY|nr:Similar to aspartate aminotransferase [Candidatus Methanoperedens nitroreducens]
MVASSWVTKMFEEKVREKEIYDFTLGNPEIETPAKFTEELKRIVNNPFPGMHRYTPLAGYTKTREAIAKTISKEYGLSFSAQHVIMTAGCAGALNVALKALLNPGEEVIILAPSYVEYPYYIDNHSGVCRIAETNPDFTINIDNIASKINSSTKAIILNSPNNPTGEIYPEKTLESVAKLLYEKSQEFGKDIFLIFDEAYRDIVYDGIKLPDIFKIYSNTIITAAYSKPLSIPGERIGYAAVNPKMEEAREIMEAMTFANRILGYINAPALMQRVITNLQGVRADIAEYQERRDFFCDALDEFGYSFIRPKGTYYIFPESPVDDLVFSRELFREGIFVFPGAVFGRSGYFRIAFCVKKETIKKSLQGFRKALLKYKNV